MRTGRGAGDSPGAAALLPEVLRLKAIVQRTYGSADVLEFVDVDMPAVGDRDVLVRVHAASLHIGDWHVMTGLPYMLRVVGFGLRTPNVRTRGMDVAGKVEEAAAVPTSAFAALQALRNRGEVRPGHKVLVVGASGGVGIFAVQIAKSFGAEVTGVCSTTKIDLVRSLGADHVVDYTREDFAASDRRYDIVLDTGGRRSLSDLRRTLSPRGTLVLVGGEGGNRVLGGTEKWIQALLLSPFVRQKLRPLASEPNKKDLLLVKELIEDGKVRPVIDRSFTLSEVPDAFRYLKEGHGAGKVVITVDGAISGHDPAARG